MEVTNEEPSGVETEAEAVEAHGDEAETEATMGMVVSKVHFCQSCPKQMDRMCQMSSAGRRRVRCHYQRANLMQATMLCQWIRQFFSQPCRS